MSVDLGRPTRAAEVRAMVEERLGDWAAQGGTKETVTIPWRNGSLAVEVIDMPVETLCYNPATHRIRAQRSYDPKLDEGVSSSPWSDASQAYLDYLLKASPADPTLRDERFTDLVESLRDYKQTEPGLITRDGVLVNGNTRCAALRELKHPHIRVGVLPASTTWADINAIELALQLRQEHKRDYSYINRLLAIEELTLAGAGEGEIAHTFRIATETVRQDKWILGRLREMIERSAEGDATLRLVDFEQDQEKLKELRRRWAKDKEANPDAAEVVKELRFAAIVLGFAKTDVRLVDTDFRKKFLSAHLAPELLPTAASTTPVAIPGLGRSVSGASAPVAEAKAFTDFVLRTKAKALADSVEAEKVLGELEDAVGEAIADARDVAQNRKRRQAAPAQIANAIRDLEQCVSEVVISRGSQRLDEELFDDAVMQLRDVLTKLAEESRRTIAEPGDGVSWLITATERQD